MNKNNYYNFLNSATYLGYVTKIKKHKYRFENKIFNCLFYQS